MAKFPYTASVKSLSDGFSAFRRSLPAVIGAQTLKKLGIAPNSESALISVLQFLGTIDDSGKPTKVGHDLFLASDERFPANLADLVTTAYHELFSLHGSHAWDLPTEQLTTFFRQSDRTSLITGERQAKTFAALASLSSNRSANNSSKSGPKRASSVPKPSTKGKSNAGQKGPATAAEPEARAPSIIPFSVRIEVNLPVSVDQSVYDAIFKSLKANFLDAAD